MRIIIACEESARVREAFRRRGHDAWSCDILPSAIPGQHIQDNILNHLQDGWDAMIAFPPCTYLCNSGVRWLYERPGRWRLMEKAAVFFRRLMNAYKAPYRIPKIGLENPIMHKHAKRIICRDYTQIIQPWQFGHGETKATCLWLRGFPKLKPTDIVEGREARIHKMPPGPKRSKERSRTYIGIAEAMAEQWG